MGLHFKILDGNTPKSGKSLCLSCGYMARRTGQNLEDEIYCSSYRFENSLGEGNRVPFRVSECTEYKPFNQQGLKDMYEIAWVIQARKKGPPGFAPQEGVKVVDEKGEETVIEIVPPNKKKSDDEE